VDRLECTTRRHSQAAHGLWNGMTWARERRVRHAWPQSPANVAVSLSVSLLFQVFPRLPVEPKERVSEKPLETAVLRRYEQISAHVAKQGENFVHFCFRLCSAFARNGGGPPSPGSIDGRFANVDPFRMGSKENSCPQMTQIDADKVPNPRSSASSTGNCCLIRPFTKWVRSITYAESRFLAVFPRVSPFLH